MRRIIEAILYVLRSGCPWRLLPDSFPPWGTVYGWFSELRDAGVFESLNHHLVQRDRARLGRAPCALLAVDRIGFAYPRAAREWLPALEAEPERIRVSDGEGVRRLALAGVGPARLAEFTISRDVDEGRLVPIVLKELPPVDEAFHAVYVGRSDRLPARVRALLDYLAEAGRVDVPIDG